MNEREADVVLSEAAPHLAYLSTEALYEEQPELWKLGEHGRHHTLNDFTLHFRAIASGVDAFRAYAQHRRLARHSSVTTSATPTLAS